MIDFHTHQPLSGVYGPEEVVRGMDEVGVDISVVFTYEGLLHPSPEANDSLAAFVAADPERLVAFATVDPRDPGAAAEIERCVTEHGMRGIKLHPWLQGFSAHEPGLDPVCEAAAALRVPVLFHDGTPPFSTPLQLATLARRHPATTVVLGHGGLHDLWREAVAAVLTTSNVHLCMCATPLYAMRAIVARCPLERLLFGTDAGLRPEPLPRYAVLRLRQLEELGLTAGQRAAILDANPRQLLGWGGSVIDVHTHVPTHRERVPADEMIVNTKWRPDRAVSATTTWAEYEEAFADVEVSVAFTIARDRERVVPELNDDVAAFVAAAPGRRIGFLSVHPEVPGWEDEVERACDLGLRGVKLGPNYQIFDPLGDAALRLYGLAETRGLPVLFHQGASPVREAPLRYAHPLLMDEIAIRFPELRIVMAHMGHPWWRETIVTIRKHPHVYADVSALFYRPWSLYEGMRLVTEWNVFDRLLFGSDFPIATPAETAAGLRRVNDLVAGTGLPPVPLEAIEEIIERDPLPLLGLAHPARGG